MAKLSEHARDLLLVIYQQSEVDWDTGEVKKWFVPPSGRKIIYLAEFDNKEVLISGAATASAFRGLKNKGLIQENKDYKYWAAITEEGVLQAQKELYPDTNT